MEYTKDLGPTLEGPLNPKDLDAPAVNPMFDVDLRLKKKSGRVYGLVAVVKNFRHEKAINVSVICMDKELAPSSLPPFWGSFEVYLGDVIHTVDGKYELRAGSVFDSSYKSCDRLLIHVTSCGDGNTFKADVAGILSDSSKGMVVIH